jgi:hypothetical protein
MYSGTCKAEKKVFLQKKVCILVSFKCLTFDFLNYFYFLTVPGSESVSELFVSDSDSDPDSFGFGSTTLLPSQQNVQEGANYSKRKIFSDF